MTNLLPKDHPWSGLVQIHDCLPSTNTYLKAQKDAPHGTAVIARAQTGGRGRMGRSFSSPEGQGVYLSLLLRPNCPAKELMHLTCAVAVAMTDAVQDAAGVTPDIKWVNDLMLGKRKLGGILTEMSLSPDGTAEQAVIGVGINCLQTSFPPELSGIATSLYMETGKVILPETLATHMLLRLSKMWDTLFSEKDAVMDAYRARCITTGREVQVIQGTRVQNAYAVRVNDDGSLTVRWPDGREETVSSGEVSVKFS